MKTILVVDDEPDTAEMLAEMMRLSGFQALTSFDGCQAMRLLESYHPDAVLLDVMMPDLCGLDVLRLIRSDPHMQALPVIILSARGMPADVQSGMEAGADRYLSKPVGYLELKSAIEEALVKGRSNLDQYQAFARSA